MLKTNRRQRRHQRRGAIVVLARADVTGNGDVFLTRRLRLGRRSHARGDLALVAGSLGRKIRTRRMCISQIVRIFLKEQRLHFAR